MAPAGLARIGSGKVWGGVPVEGIIQDTIACESLR